MVNLYDLNIESGVVQSRNWCRTVLDGEEMLWSGTGTGVELFFGTKRCVTRECPSLMSRGNLLRV